MIAARLVSEKSIKKGIGVGVVLTITLCEQRGSTLSILYIFNNYDTNSTKRIYSSIIE